MELSETLVNHDYYQHEKQPATSWQSDNSNTEILKLADEEELFEHQYQNWEREFEKWKKDNINFSNKSTYKEYKYRYELRHLQLLRRRRQLHEKKRRLMANTIIIAPVLQAMASFKFNKPINRTVVYELNENDETLKMVQEQGPSPPISSSNQGLNVNLLTEMSFDTMENSLNIETISETNNNGNDSPEVDFNFHLNNTSQTKNTPHTQIDRNKSIDTINVKKILDKIAVNLISVLESFFYFHNNAAGKPKNLVERARHAYLTCKHRFYEMAYRTTVDHILPHEHNTEFTEQFLNRCLELASNKPENKIEMIHIKKLFNNLIDWTKRNKKNYTSLNCGEYSRPYCSPDVNLQPEPQAHDKTISNDKKNNNEVASEVPNQICLFTSTVGNDGITISVSPEIYNQTYISNTNTVTQKITPISPLSSSTRRKRKRTDDHIISNHSSSNANDQSRTQAPFNNYNVEPVDYNYNNSNEQRQRLLPPNNNGLCYNQNTHIHCQTQISTNGFIDENSPNHPFNLYENTRWSYAPTQNENNILNVEPRSSVSRDSGFISPLRNDTFDQMSFPQNEQTSMPFISHVTSMNPNASFIEKRNCKMCNQITNKACIVCYKEYYCSTACQAADWPIHILTCRRHDNSHQHYVSV